MHYARTLPAILIAIALIGASASLTLGDDITTIRGRVIFKGDANEYKRTVVDRSQNPACAKEVEKVETESVVLTLDTDPITIKNVLVAIGWGLSEHGFMVPKQPVMLIQHGCQFKPHVLGIMAGQPLKVINADETIHRPHFMCETNKKYAFTQQSKDLQKGRELTLVSEPPFQVKSDLYPWMDCYIGVFTHPFHSVTGDTGMYELRGVPPGTYMLSAWHEVFGTAVARVRIARGETKIVDFTFDPAQRKDSDSRPGLPLPPQP